MEANILIDDREGSRDLINYLPPKLAQLHRLEYGDAAFAGIGPSGRPVLVGVEVKQLSDVLKCIMDGRFSGDQLPGMLRTYYTSYLVITGIFKADERTGILVQFRGSNWTEVKLGSRRFMAADLESWLLTHEIKAGIKTRHVSGIRQAADFILSLYRWWDKGWDEHRSHLATHNTTPDSEIMEASLARRMAKELPGIGWTRSKAVEKAFPSIIRMICANEIEWRQIEGIGPKTAESVVREIRKERR